MKRRLLVALGLLAALALILLLYRALVADTINATAATTAATMVAALATAVAAWAAMRAAQESSATAQTARNALSRAIEPVLQIEKANQVYGDEGTPMEVVLYMMTPQAAVELRGEVTLNDGRRERFSEERLPGEVPGVIKGDGWRFQPSGQDAGGGPVDITEVTVAFSDEMHMVRYEQTATWSGGGPVPKSVKRALSGA